MNLSDRSESEPEVDENKFDSDSAEEWNEDDSVENDVIDGIYTFRVGGEEKTEMLVNLSWYQYHPDHLSKGKPLTMWSTEFKTLGLYSCIPVSFV